MDSCKKRIKQILTDWGRFLCVIPLRIFYEPLIYIIMKFNFPFSFYFFFFGRIFIIVRGVHTYVTEWNFRWEKFNFNWFCDFLRENGIWMKRKREKKKLENFAQVLRKEACELISRKHWKLTEMTIFEIGKNEFSPSHAICSLHPHTCLNI